MHAHLAARLYNAPLLITPEKAEVIERVFRAREEGGAALTAPTIKEAPKPDAAVQFGGTRTQAGYVRTSDGMAVIQVVGSLMQRSAGLDALSGIESYQNLASQFDAAMKDPMVHGVLLEIDSPGGEAAGLFDFAGDIRAAANTKPVVAHANEHAFSAAYAIAASAGELYMPQTGRVGSVGVILMHVDQSGKDAKQGVKYTPITAGAKKAEFSPHAPLSDEGRATAQKLVDQLYGTFVDHVATARGIDPQAVRDTEAGLLIPSEATDIGFADGVLTLNGAADRLRTLMTAGGMPAYRRSKASANTKGLTMSITKEEMDAAVAKARTEGAAEAARAAEAATAKALADATAKAQADAAEAGKAAQVRAGAILNHEEAKGREALANHLAFNTAQSVDEAVAMLKAAPKAEAKTNRLDAALRNTNPNVGAGAEPGDAPKVRIDAGSIYAARAKACQAAPSR